MSAALRDAAQAALDLLRSIEGAQGIGRHDGLTEICEALRAALAEPAQEPVAHICILPTKDAGPTKFFTAPSDPRGFPVYAAPQAVAPLTEKPADPSRLAAVRAAIHAYHSALDRRQHAGVAQGHAMQAIEEAMDMPWIQGATLPERGIGGGK